MPELAEETPVEVVETPELIEETTINMIANFVDPSKDPQYYIDRYYNETIYKTWFDKNYPELTIEEAVGYTDNTSKIQTTVQEIIDKEIIPEAEAVSVVNPTIQQNDNSDMIQISLGVVGLLALFAAVYGVKRKVDDNSKRISINRESIRQKFIRPIIGSNPKDILQIRLAKGEITLEEYEKIKLKFY